MADNLTAKQRSRCMSKIRSKNTRPEILVRKLIYQMGYRYRLHVRSLPGSPDLVFTRLRKIIFVHGCFWHMHDCPYGMPRPKTNSEYWRSKRVRTVERDLKNLQTLKDSGWEILIIWECWTKNLETLKQRLSSFLTDC